MRLDKFLANAGLGSRKEVKSIIKDGRVLVNNHFIKSDKYNIDELNDKIYVDNELIEFHQFYYILLNKPAGYVSSTEIERNYPPVTDLVSEYNFAKIFPVGRLDVDTTGVLLLSNNGQLAHKLLSPKYHVDKTYLVTTDYPLQKEMIVAFEKGVILDDGYETMPSQLKILKSDDMSEIELTIHEGKFHQVKRMFESVGKKVVYLKRLSMGKLKLDESLGLGEYRELTEEEVKLIEER